MEAAAGDGLLAAIEETSLDEILSSLRASLEAAATSPSTANAGNSNSNIASKAGKLTHHAELDEIAARHFRATQAAAVSITGRSLALLYHLLSSLVSPPHQLAVLVVDLEDRFDATRLACGDSDARHIYVQRAARIVPGTDGTKTATDSPAGPEQLRALVAEAEGFILYGAHASAARSWWGTVVVGGMGAGDMVAGWKGWLRVDREAVRSFPLGTSAAEALGRREARQEAVDAAGWAATSQWGGFVFHDE